MLALLLALSFQQVIAVDRQGQPMAELSFELFASDGSPIEGGGFATDEQGRGSVPPEVASFADVRCVTPGTSVGRIHGAMDKFEYLAQGLIGLQMLPSAYFDIEIAGAASDSQWSLWWFSGGGGFTQSRFVVERWSGPKCQIEVPPGHRIASIGRRGEFHSMRFMGAEQMAQLKLAPHQRFALRARATPSRALAVQLLDGTEPIAIASLMWLHPMAWMPTKGEVDGMGRALMRRSILMPFASDTEPQPSRKGEQWGTALLTLGDGRVFEVLLDSTPAFEGLLQLQLADLEEAARDQDESYRSLLSQMRQALEGRSAPPGSALVLQPYRSRKGLELTPALIEIRSLRDGEPDPWQHVMLRSGGQLVVLAMTDHEGRARVAVRLPEEAQLVAMGVDWSTYGLSSKRLTETDRDVTLIRERDPGSATISGRLLDPDGAPMAFRVLNLHGDGAAHTFLIGDFWTDALGRFTSDRVLTGAYTLQLGGLRRGTLRLNQPLDVTPNGLQDLTVRATAPAPPSTREWRRPK